MYYKDGEEFSFEELRAVLQKYKFRPPPAPFHFKPSPFKLVNLSPAVKNFASPTINTKAALADVFEMFNQPLNDEVDQEDETISSKLYKPTIDENTDGGMMVFKDDGTNHDIGKLKIFREENPFVSPEKETPARKPFGIKPNTAEPLPTTTNETTKEFGINVPRTLHQTPKVFNSYEFDHHGDNHLLYQSTSARILNNENKDDFSPIKPPTGIGSKKSRAAPLFDGKNTIIL